MSRTIQLMVRADEALLDEHSEWMQGVDGMVLSGPQISALSSIRNTAPRQLIFEDAPCPDTLAWQEDRACRWCCDEGLEQAARLRDEWPDLEWLPRLDVFRPQLSYRFSGPGIGEGFSFYIPDTSAIRGWRVNDGEIMLSEAVAKASALGFDALWLHSLDAEQAAQGLELEMLDRTVDSDLAIWISGGACAPRHLQNLARVGGVSSVVIDGAWMLEQSAEELCEQLIPRQEIISTEVSFGCGQGCAG